MRGPASRESPAYVGTRDRVELNDSIFQQLVQIVLALRVMPVTVCLASNNNAFVAYCSTLSKREHLGTIRH